MVNNHTDMAEEPVVRAISYHVNVIRDIPGANSSPTFGYDCSDIRHLGSIKNELGQGLHIVDHNGSKTNVNRRRAGIEEIRKIWWRRIRAGLR